LLILSIEPFAEIIAKYSCHNREEKCYYVLQSGTSFPLGKESTACMNVQYFPKTNAKGKSLSWRVELKKGFNNNENP